MAVSELMNKHRLAVIVIAYNRVQSLERLLDSLNCASGIENVDLFICIDGGGSREVPAAADKFQWKGRRKEIILQEKNLGLKDHMLKSISIVEDYDAVVVLEDDLLVSPYFAEYSYQALDFYKDEKNIAGISLYSYNYNEYARKFFIPLNNGYDSYFIQSATSWGQLFTRDEWRNFLFWYSRNKYSEDFSVVSHFVEKWPGSSWKKYFIKYMNEKKRYFVCPNISLSTNMGEIGTHHKLLHKNLQVPLLSGTKEFRFSPFNDDAIKYDSYYEMEAESLKRRAPFLEEYDFEMDLYGKKDISRVKSEYLISIKHSGNSILQFGMRTIPLETNIIFNIRGDRICLAAKNSFKKPKKEVTEDFNQLMHKTMFLESDGIMNYVNHIKKLVLSRFILK